jgi:hypothetical protein
MAFNLSNLTAYTDEVSQELITKAVAQGKTLDRISVIPGVTKKTALNFLDNTVSIQNGTNCGFESNGEVTFSQRFLETVALEVQESLCPNDLKQYWTGQLMKAGSAKDVDSLMPILGESYIEKINAAIEKQIWLGDNESSPPVGHINGFVQLLSGEATRVTTDLGSPDIMAGPFTSDNIISVVNAMVADIPEAILDKTGLVLNMSMGNYRLYTQALRTANLIHEVGADGVAFSITILGTSVTAMGVTGLSGSNKMILTYNDNLVFGTDLLGEQEKFEIWYSFDNKEVRVNIQWTMGVQVRFPEFCVCNF